MQLFDITASSILLSLELPNKKKPSNTVMEKEFNSLDYNTGTDPVTGELFITDDFNVLLWQLTSGMQQLITTKLAR